MTMIRITLQSVCPGGDHLVLNVSTTSNGNVQYNFTDDELRTRPDPDQIQSAVKIIAQYHCTGMTRVSAAQALNAGILVRTSV